MPVTIDVYCNDGSPIGVVPPDIYTRGVGGAELSLITWAETMVSRGHTVRIFNSPKFSGEYSGVHYMQQREFSPDDARDVLIAWRSPFPLLAQSRAGTKIHWSCDQYTVGDYARDILPHVANVVTISPFHTNYYRRRYNTRNIIPDERIHHIDLGVRAGDYSETPVEKDNNLMLWTSVPDRGLDILLAVWGDILKRIPKAKLVITSDYTLWGGMPIGERVYKPRWSRYMDSVTYAGAIERRELTKLQQTAAFSIGSFSYDELFCIASAEAQWCGAVSVTGDKGALPTTNRSGVVLRFGELKHAIPAVIADLYNHPARLRETSVAAALYAQQRFDWQYIAQKWEYLFATGNFD